MIKIDHLTIVTLFFFQKKMAAFQNHKLVKFSCLDDNLELQSLISNVVYAINKKNSPQSETLDYSGHLNDLHPKFAHTL